MTIRLRYSSLLLVLLSISAWAQSPPEARSLFNGKDLTGWDGNPANWSVEDGCITGVTKGDEPLPYNQFLIWRGGSVKNFELRAMIRQKGNNSGIQYRSRELKDVGPWSIGGYQCDVHPEPANNAMLYDERGRGIVAQNGQTVIVDPSGQRWLTKQAEPMKVDVTEWNEYKIMARGNRLIHQLNGHVTIDVIDHQANERELEGLLAFQIHRGPAMKVQIKDIMLKELPDAELISPEQAPIPASAKLLPGPGGAAKKGTGKKKSGKSQGADEKRKESKAARKSPAKTDPSGPMKRSNQPTANDRPQAATKKQRTRHAATGLMIGENKATPIERMKVAKGFRIELLHSVPAPEQGSWVNLCVDDKGRIIASDQYGGLFRFASPPPGQVLDPAKIEKVPAEIRAVNGMVWAFGALYVGVNDYEKKIDSGLYKLTDSNGDDRLDKVELLRAMEARGDHGVHAVLKTPDGKGLFLVTGNGTKPTTFQSSRVPPYWGEDHLLSRMPDGRGFMRDVLAPGGIIYRVSPDGKDFEIVSSGYRNIFDAALNRDGELFTYDADMEYDFNTSWYRPTRVCHVVSGSEYGWRNGAGKWPEWYPDNLPPVINIGPGSPTGMTFGYGAKFPAKYQEALFILDWSWGKLFAIHLQPQGASYSAEKEEFLSGAPLPLTDILIHPTDGAMYFAIGGRKVQSGLYRVTYEGPESTAPSTPLARHDEDRQLRQRLEAFHGRQDPQAVPTAWPFLGHSDRFIRWAARTAIEHQPEGNWGIRALIEPDPSRQVEALLAISRVSGIDPFHRRPEHPPIDIAKQAAIFTALDRIDWDQLTREQQITLVRTYEITLNRFGRPDEATVQRLMARLDPLFPAPSRELNWLLCETLVYLQSPTIAAKTLALMKTAATQEEQIEYARSLRMLKAGWTKETRTAYLEWFLKAANFRGGASFEKFIEFIRNDAVATLTETEKTELAHLLVPNPVRKSPLEVLSSMFAGRPQHPWTLDELAPALQTPLVARNYDHGRKMFGATACFTCHRFANEGGMTGPDLTSAGRRYSPRDLLDHVINPNKEINDQFVPVIVQTSGGLIVQGVIVNLNGDTLTVNTDPTDPNQRVTVDRKEVVSLEPSKVSPMPTGLLNPLSKEEILDLISYVLSGGDPHHEVFRK